MDDVTLQIAKTEKWIPVFPTFSEITFIFIHFKLNGLIFIALACFGVTLMLCQDEVQWHNLSICKQISPIKHNNKMNFKQHCLPFVPCQC